MPTSSPRPRAVSAVGATPIVRRPLARRARRVLSILALLAALLLMTGGPSVAAWSAEDGLGAAALMDAPPTAPTNVAATPGAFGVTLTWTAATDDVGVHHYLVTLAGQTKLPSGTSTWIGGLAATTTYTATVTAVDTAGNLSPAAPVTFTTLTPSETQPPTTPTGLTATPTTTSVTLTWTASTDNVKVAGYVVTVGPFTQSVSGTTALVTGLTPKTTYLAKVVAKDAAGNTSPAAQTPFTTLTPPDTTAPTAPTGLIAAPGTDRVTLTWTASTDNVGVTAYVVTVGATSTTVTTPTATITGLSAKTAYTASVVAKDAAGNTSATAQTPFTTLTPPDTTAPTAPTGLIAAPGTDRVTLTWTASTDNVGVTAYVVTVGATSTTATTPTATITGLSAKTAYTASVVAKDAAGNTSLATQVPFTTLALPTGPSLYVSPSGLDTNPGTSTAPLKTIQVAVDKATPGTTIRLYAGTYDSAKTIRIRNSGTITSPITITPAGNGPVLVTHSVKPVLCTNSRPAPDRTFTINDGADNWVIEGLTIHNGIWIAGKRSNNAYNWLTNYVNAGNWSARRAAPGHGVQDANAARTALVPFLRTVTGYADLDPAERITIRNNVLTGRGIYGALTSYGVISGNTIRDIPCGIGPGIWLMTFSNGWTISGNDVSDIAISEAAHFMQEGIRIGSAANYNEVTGNRVHDLPGDGRGINTDVDASWNYFHHNAVTNVAIGYNDQMSGWGNRWEYNTVTNYRTYGFGFRLKDATLTMPSLASSTKASIVRCNVTTVPVGGAKALGVGGMMATTFAGNDMPRLWISKNARVYWSGVGNSWNGSSTLPPEYPTFVGAGC